MWVSEYCKCYFHLHQHSLWTCLVCHKDLLVKSMGSTRYGLPVIQVTENTQVVEILLQFCYLITNACASALTTVEEILPLMEAAIKYSIEGVVHCARDALIKPPLVEENPILIFAIYQHG
jgi:hypothetical protein